MLRRRFSRTLFDLAVIGGGPGGYVAAIKAAQLGLKTVCVDNRELLGGTCLNVGCVPSKFLLKVAYKYSDLLSGSRFGVKCQNPKFDWAEIQRRKNETVGGLAEGIESLFRKNEVTRVTGTASFKDLHSLVVRGQDGRESELKAANYLIATGSKPKPLANVSIDEKVICSSTGILALETVPKRLLVIGAGVIGLELGSVYKSLGSEVTFIESGASVLPEMDSDIVKEYQGYLVKDGFRFAFNSAVLRGEISATTNEAVVYARDTASGKDAVFTGDACLVATGRVPNTEQLGLANLGLKTDKKGRIEVDNRFSCGVGSIYAIGDVISGPMLAHKAEEEGAAVAEFLSGKQFAINYDAVPSVVYTEPEIAFVGKTEQQLRLLGIPFKAGVFPMSANSRSRTAMESRPGLVKILAHRDTDRVLGAHIVSSSAGEMIAEMALAISQKACSEDIARFSHAHPTLSEGIREAALAVTGKAIHC